MPEVSICIRVVDKVNSDPRLDAGCRKRGDVVNIRPADWQWSADELANPNWVFVIVDIPNYLIDSLLEPEVGEFVDRVPRRNMYKIKGTPQGLLSQIEGNHGVVHDLRAEPINWATIVVRKPDMP